MEEPIISGIAFNRDEAKVVIRGVPDQPGVASRILAPVSDANIEIDMIVQNVSADGTTDFTFTVNRTDCARTIEILEAVCKELGAGGAQHLRGEQVPRGLPDAKGNVAWAHALVRGERLLGELLLHP